MAAKSEARICDYGTSGKCKKVKNSFHTHFTKSRLVSHFRGTGRKHETSARFIGALPMRSLSKTMKRDVHLFHALVSRETALVSARFTFRFTRSARVRPRPLGM